MPNRCVAPGCKVNYDSCKEKCSIIAAPKEEERRLLWQRANPRKDFVLKPSHYLCEKHFHEENIVRKITHKDQSDKIIAQVEISYNTPKTNAHTTTLLPEINPEEIVAAKEVVPQFEDLKPNQPNDRTVFPVQNLKNKTLSFQTKWYTEHKWLHSVAGVNGVTCFYCSRYIHNCPDKILAKRCDPAFTTKGFTNWKKALEKFKIHESSDSHLQAVLSYRQTNETLSPINAQLKTSLATEQECAYKCLVKILSTVKFLARQGLPFRGHRHDGGNFQQLIELRAEDCPELRTWLQRKKDWCSPDIQNEILMMLSNELVKKLVTSIHSQNPVIFSVVCDGTRDISGKEQISICLRYVDENLNPTELFVGLYDADSTTGEAISNIIFDLMIRLQLSTSHLRGQAYDGASNMSGHKKGVQAIVKERQPLAPFIHCGAHSVNLVLQDACDASVVIRNALQLAHDLGVLFSQSLNARHELKKIMELKSSSPVTNITSIKPLCPTRWVHRGSQLDKILQNYGLLLETLEQLDAEKNCHAHGLLEQFESSSTVLGLVMAKHVIEKLEVLNKALQGSQQTVSGMMEAVTLIEDSISKMRSEVEFQNILTEANNFTTEHNLKELLLPRQRKPPKRFTGPADAFEATTVDQYFRREFFMMVDSAVSGLHSRFNQEGIKKMQKLEDCLLKGEICDELASYPEVNSQLLKTEVELFLKKHKPKSVKDVSKILLNSVLEVRQLFSNIEVVLRLLLVVPSSSCSAERSFSSLRRLKTYLRSTMTQARLNHVAVLHAHQHELDVLDLNVIASQFISKNERRGHVFGKR